MKRAYRYLLRHQRAPEVAVEPVSVALHAPDPLTHAGLASYLQSHPEITLLPDTERDQAGVLVVAVDRLTADVITTLRRLAAEIGAPVTLITTDFDERELLTAIECRVVAILPRAMVTTERLARSVLAAAFGGGVLPAHLVGELLRHVEQLRRETVVPAGATGSGLSAREVDVLRLMADGLDTNEIADELCYSERTIKNVIYGMTQRLKLRNRSHAVAYALRAGMI